jgi:hypothetical protein
MYVIIGSYFVPLEGKFLLIALVIVRITLNVIVRQMPLNRPLPPINDVSIVQKLVKLSNTSTMLFPPVAKTLSKCLRV